MGKGDLRWWEKLPDFSLSNLNAKTRKEIKEITFLKFLRQGFHHSNNEGFWKIRSRVHTSCRLSSKYIFSLNFLCVDFLITDTHYSLTLSGAMNECCLQCFSPASLRIKGGSAPSERTGKTPAGQASLGISLGEIFSPCNYVGIHLLSKAVFSQGERLPNLCLIMHKMFKKQSFPVCIGRSFTYCIIQELLCP